MKVLYKFTHGLGDAVQFTCVLQHLKKYRPNVEISVAAMTGKQSCFFGQCEVFNLDKDTIDESQYDQIVTPGWYENFLWNTGTVHTKIGNFLREEWQINPEESLLRYKINVYAPAMQQARRYLSAVTGVSEPPYPVVTVHYEGNTSSSFKNLSHQLAEALCRAILNMGYVPIILDWDHRSPLPDNQKIFCPDCGPGDIWGETGTGDAEVLAALISQCQLMVGVDSGPLHVAGSTETPTIGVWTKHHPIRFFDLCPNVLHLIPHDWESTYPCDSQPLAREFFNENYRYVVYEDLQETLIANVMKVLPFRNPVQRTGLMTRQAPIPLSGLTSLSFNRRYYDEHRESGLDYLNYGPWQEEYGRWFVESLNLKGNTLLDVGCACGSIMIGFGKAGAITQGIDVSEYMIELAKRHRPDMTPILFVCDAVNMHIFPDDLWDAVHSAQSAEHWKPELVPFILREISRVTKKGGIFFCALDTEELFARQNRKMENEDPTHVCVKPLQWWHDQLAANGWEVCSDEVRQPLMDHPESFMRRYDWDWFAARNKKPGEVSPPVS